MKRLAEEAQRSGRPLQAKQVCWSNISLILCSQSHSVNQLVTTCGGKALAGASITCRVLLVAAQEKWIEPHSLIEQLLVCIPSARWVWSGEGDCVLTVTLAVILK